MSKKIIVIACFIVGTPCLLLLGLYLICGPGSDLTSFNAPELEFSLEDIPEEENAYSYFLNAANKYTPIYEFDDVLHEFDKDEWEEKNVTKILQSFQELKVQEKNQAALDLLEKGLAQTKYQYPNYLHYDTPIAELSPLRLLCTQVAIYKALTLFQEGNQKKAFEVILQVIKIGSDIQRTPVFIFFIVGQVIIDKALDTIIYLLPQVTSPDILKNFIANNQYVITTSQNAWVMCQKGEYYAFCHLIDNIHDIFDGNIIGNAMLQTNFPLKEKFSQIFLFKPNRTKMIMAEYFLHIIKNSEKNWLEIEANQIKLEELQANIINRYGWQVIMTLTPYTYNNKKVAIQIKIAETLVALKLYKMEHNTLPESLDELVGKYLNEAPIDDYDGAPIRYSSKTKTVHSELQENGKYSFYYEIKF